MNKITFISVMIVSALMMVTVNAYGGAPSKGRENYSPKYEVEYAKRDDKYEPIYGRYGYEFHEPVYKPHYQGGYEKYVYVHDSDPYDYLYAKSLPSNFYYVKKQYPVEIVKKIVKIPYFTPY